MTLKICVAQLNLVVGDMAGNARKIIESAQAAYKDGARLVLTPELSICGYAAEDLFLRSAFISACDEAVVSVAEALADLKDLCVVVGHPTGGDQRTRSVAVQTRLNAASVLCEGHVVATYAKRELPNYQVFDERRYFTPGQEVCVFEVGEPGNRLRVGLLICEDAWFDAPARETAQAGAELLVVINASPFHVGKGHEREQMMRQRVLACGLPLVYAHLVGGQDEVVFEGHSFALNANGGLAGRAPSFIENSLLVQVDKAHAAILLEAKIEPDRSSDADLWDALVLGVRDYINKNGFPGVLLGLSGGIDSALVLAIAVDALGQERVRAVMMPSPYTADISWIDARDMAQRLGVRYDELSIVPEFEAFKATLAGEFSGLAEDATEENIQARIRGTLLMALSNKFGSIVLTTGNKSEMATGYCTLYGDMAGGFAVIKDLAKTTVFRLACWRNTHDPYGTGVEPIPERIITRPPSAELRPDQKDQDSLPPYEVLDGILERYMENDEGIEQIIAAGFAPADVERVTRLIKINEYKRRQSPVGIRVTHRSFGKDWRYPITNRFRA
ncbi:glutamine-dependent NAD(+) synthetase [Rhodoferax lithotrophicus]|uniref:Glutamine-dependent NAD(+) synthetase n=1 Tax=Rhodoferax lithotrophicus TaxID=2798804 RepID=A0ABM7MKL8_9BURK|nr:NAD+ synthase [Rhodoferax sp. MIZ03]BCO26839.1 glutamine-dependent NAD(+) synthetase [Rhodoferax sp. MIZ03]